MKVALRRDAARALWPRADSDSHTNLNITAWAPHDLVQRSFLKTEETSQLRCPMEDDEWRRLYGIIRDMVAHTRELEFTRIADHIARLIRYLDPIMTSYCRQTCPTCEDPCCSGRKVFFNQTDLVYLAVQGEAAVPGQTRTREGEPCRYLSRDGCRLTRLNRPYVCVWFICEPQMEMFQGEPTRFQRSVTEALQDIRQARLLLETLYEGCLG